ncbi:MAG: efflux RND transporter permease subunit [Planctomycetes bacterium]|nr:efflux RND transporter permease subunit [Planctomycetota bacterium]
MLEKLMHLSLNNRLIVLIGALGLFLVGVYTAVRLPVDVFPDLTAPTVTIITEAHGMAPEEVEMLVTFPLETTVNGASGVRRVRSNSIQGLSVIWVEFEWGTDIYTARQIVNEKLQSVQNAIPDEVDRPILAPITSIMGEIMLIGVTSDITSAMEIRTLADFTLRRRLRSIPGVAQVLVYGGETKQYQVQIDPYLLRKYRLTMQQILHAVSATNVNATGGVFVDAGQEYLIRGIGRIRTLDDLEYTVVATHEGVPLLIRDVAKVAIAPATRLGTASINNRSGVILVISKQPDANTLVLTRKIEAVMDEIRPSLPPDVTLHTDIFKQSDFIEVAIQNVVKAIRDGAILVVFVLFIFLMNIRTTAISVIAIPLALIVSILVLKLLGLSINTMTLGGMAIAIGVLVDDGIVYIENVYRRIRENVAKPESERRPFDDVVADASSEIRAPLAMATPIVIMVFIPFFFLSGVEGRMLTPLGLAYVVAVFASLMVAVTVTPALSSYMLRNVSSKQIGDTWLVRRLKTVYLPTLEWCLRRKNQIIGFAGLMVVVVLAILPFMGRSFLPEFNEGTLNISVATVPGTSLDESDQIGKMVEGILLSHPNVISTARRTGRTELDEHSMGSHAHELEVKIDLVNIDKQVLLETLRRDLTLVPGTIITIGQPISHRIDHMLSGTRANIAVKIFGEDLLVLREVAKQVETVIGEVAGVVDLSIEQQTDIPVLRVDFNRKAIARYGLRIADVAKALETGFRGDAVTQILEGRNAFDLVVRVGEPPKADNDKDAGVPDSWMNASPAMVGEVLVDTPEGLKIPLKALASITQGRGPNMISRENAQRKIVVMCNVAGRDLGSVVAEIQQVVSQKIDLPQGYYVQYGGQFESAQETRRLLGVFGVVVILGIGFLLHIVFRSVRDTLLIMINLPLALIGGVVGVYLSGGILSVASLIGFISVFGIAARNGIMMVSHIRHLQRFEGVTDFHEAVRRGAMERLAPILMTAMAAGFALIPLAFGGDQPGREILTPMAIVILFGLLSSTFLNMVVVPALFLRFGRPVGAEPAVDVEAHVSLI